MSAHQEQGVASGTGEFRLVVAIVAALLVTFAAEVDAEERGAAEIFDVVTVVASKVEERVGEIAGTATVIGRQEMDRRLVQSVDDIVRYEPGVSTTAEAGRFGLSSFRVRGIDGNRVVVEIDGVPMPDGFAVGSFANAGRDLVEPELLRSVEILRGPASSLHGSDALGGVLVLTTRSPADYLNAGDAGATSLRASADSRDQAWRTSALGALARGRWQLLALASVRLGHELDNNGEVAPDPATTRSTGASARLVRQLDHGLLELTLDRQQGEVETDVRHLVRGPAQFATTERLLADDQSRRSRLVLAHRFGSATSWLSEGSARLFWSDSSTVQKTTQQRGPDARTPASSLRQRRFELGEELLGAEWTGRSNLATAAASHRLVWGVEAERSKISDRRDGSETNLSTGVSTSVIVGERLPVRDFPNSEIRALGLFLADDIALGRGAWRLQPALRFDRTSSRAQPDALYREDFPTTPVVDTDDSSWTPKLGLTRELGHGHSAYAQYAEGFRAPPFYDVNIGLKIATFNYEAIPNPDLRPETSRGVELGWRYASARVAAHVALFDNRYHDLIESRANLGRDPLTGATIFQSVNRDQARIRGAEARLRLDLGRIAPAARGWTVDGAFSWAQGEDTRRDQPLNSVDPARITLGTSYISPAGRWSAGAVGSWVDDKRGEVDDSTANVFAPPGYALLDLYGEWRPSRSWTVTLALLNVLDRHYWSYGGVRGVLADDPQLDFHTEPGRGLLLGVAWRR